MLDKSRTLEKISTKSQQWSPIYCLSMFILFTHSIVFLQIYAYKIIIIIYFSVSYRYKVRKLVFPDLVPLSKIGLFFFFLFYHNTLFTEPLLTQMTNWLPWMECTMMGQGLASSKHLCKWCLMSRHTEPTESQQ